MAHRFYCGCAGKVSGEKNFDARMASLDAHEHSGEWIAEPKYDGIWLAITTAGNHTEFWSRPGKLKDVGLNHLSIPAGMILIGEAGYGSQTGKKRRKELGHEFVDVYDILMFEGKELHNLCRAERQSYLTEFFGKYPSLSSHILRSPTFTKDFVKEYLAQPEGLILKPADDGPYQLGGKKVSHWLKAKKSDTDDYVILAREMSTAETKVGANMIRHLICGGWVPSNRVTGSEHVFETKEINGVQCSLIALVDVGSMSHEWATEFGNNFEPYIGKVVEVGHYGAFDSGSRRHPYFVGLRDDKTAEECLYRIS